MKLKISGLTILILAILALSACKKDEKETKNSIKYNNTEALIGTAFSEYFGETPTQGAYGYFVYFLENSFTMHYANNYPDSISGTGDFLVLMMVSSDSSQIMPGEYAYNSSQVSNPANTFGYESGMAVNWDVASENDPAVLEFNGGKITVKKNGDVYEFTFSIKTTVNTTITGYYKGNIKIYKYWGGKKSAGTNPFHLPLIKKL